MKALGPKRFIHGKILDSQSILIFSHDLQKSYFCAALYFILSFMQITVIGTSENEDKKALDDAYAVGQGLARKEITVERM